MPGPVVPGQGHVLDVNAVIDEATTHVTDESGGLGGSRIVALTGLGEGKAFGEQADSNPFRIPAKIVNCLGEVSRTTALVYAIGSGENIESTSNRAHIACHGSHVIKTPCEALNSGERHKTKGRLQPDYAT